MTVQTDLSDVAAHVIYSTSLVAVFWWLAEFKAARLRGLNLLRLKLHFEVKLLYIHGGI